jgi:hypothetical protein
MALEGDDLNLALEAVREFSDSCNPPDGLHPNCPFARDEGGVLACGEECMDLLARMGHRTGPARPILGGAYEAFPMRPRRTRVGPDPQDMLFDARQVYLTELAQPVERRSATTLLRGLHEWIVGGVLPGDRQGTSLEASETVDELRRRGFDVDALVRDAFAPMLAMASVMRLMIDSSREEGEEGEEEEFAATRDGALSELKRLAGLLPGLGELAGRLADGSFDGLKGHEMAHLASAYNGWYRAQNLSDLIDGPNPDGFALDASRPEGEAHESDQVWIFEHFTSTFLHQWDAHSLKREWQYINAECCPPCNLHEMKSRRVDAAELQREIARRYVADPSEGGGAPDASHYVGRALGYLQTGQRAAAAAMFEVVCEMSPRSGEAFNNHGFCILPDAPEQALFDFERAESFGYSNPEILLGNKMFALNRLERYATALDLAEEAWDSLASRGGYLWDFRSATPSLLDMVDTRLYVADLALMIATKSAGHAAKARWEERLRGCHSEAASRAAS